MPGLKAGFSQIYNKTPDLVNYVRVEGVSVNSGYYVHTIATVQYYEFVELLILSQGFFYVKRNTTYAIKTPASDA